MVVAIVGILVAISIPVFTSQLAKARKATNQANMRAAKAAAVAQYMTDSKEGQAFYEYDLEEGIAKFINEKTLTTSKTIEAADSDKRYTKIEVSVKASSVESDGNTGVDTTKDDGSVVIYVE